MDFAELPGRILGMEMLHQLMAVYEFNRGGGQRQRKSVGQHEPKIGRRRLADRRVGHVHRDRLAAVLRHRAGHAAIAGADLQEAGIDRDEPSQDRNLFCRIGVIGPLRKPGAGGSRAKSSL